ncbi:MAG: hypothetical protein AB1422_00560 [bacterium]
MTTAEVMTTAIVATTFFAGNIQTSMDFLKEYHYLPNMLSKSRLNHRLQAIPKDIWKSFPPVQLEIKG